MGSAAQYVRMSTEHQRYSIEAQVAANSAYAAAQGLTIVKTYADAGVSGLHIRERSGLRALMADVLGGGGDFEAVLVADVSRWGRFQDPDEAGHYEFMCRQAGVRVLYTTEPFTDGASLEATLVKQLKRVMAAEYSRELSTKVACAKRGWSRKGFWANGPCVYGLRRQVVFPDGARGVVMERGQRKAIQDCRVILVPGPDDEVATVRRIFREYVVHGRSILTIARGLIADDVPGPGGRPWGRSQVTRVLTNAAYTGVLVVGRHPTYLRRRQPAHQTACERIDHPSSALVSRGLFTSAQRNLQRLPNNPSEERLLADLRRIWSAAGRLSQHIIDADPDSYSAALYVARFGGLVPAYERIGYPVSHHQRAGQVARLRQTRPGYVPPRIPDSNADLIVRLRALLAREGRLTFQLIAQDPNLPSASTVCDRLGRMAEICRKLDYTPSPAQQRRLRVATSSPRVVLGRRADQLLWLDLGNGASAPSGPPGTAPAQVGDEPASSADQEEERR